MNRVSSRQNPLARIQSFFEGAMDKITAVGPGDLQPAEIAHKLINAMEDNLQLQAGGIRYAPNVYDIYLSRDDHARLSPGQATLTEDWRKELENFAHQHHYTLRNRIIIRLHSDGNLSRKLVRIATELKDIQQADGNGPGGNNTATQVFNVQSMRPPQPPQTPQPPSPHAWLTIRLPGAGQQIYRIEKPEVNIGRQRSNDIIVEDKRVSRLHATISRQNGQYVLFDRKSVNGILMNGQRLNGQHALRSGDYFTIGSYDFYFDERR